MGDKLDWWRLIEKERHNESDKSNGQEQLNKKQQQEPEQETPLHTSPMGTTQMLKLFWPTWHHTLIPSQACGSAGLLPRSITMNMHRYWSAGATHESCCFRKNGQRIKGGGGGPVVTKRNISQGNELCESWQGAVPWWCNPMEPTPPTWAQCIFN